MNLETLASLSQIIGTVTIVGGTVFGLIQLWELKKQRRNAVAGDLMRTFMDADLAQAITLIRALPDGVSAEERHKLGPWLTQIRKEQSQPSWAEWFQWLAQQSQRHKSPGAPAYVLHDNWTP